MPTVFSHIAAPLAFRLGLGKQAVSPRLLTVGLLVSVLPDLDVLAFRFGIPYADSFGHRGASHSLALAVLMGLIATLAAPHLRATRSLAFVFVAISAASHGVLDMLTNGGHGVALWWPASNERFFLPWQVIEASPLSLRRVFGPKGVEVLLSEFFWVWLPCLLGGVTLLVARLIYGRTTGNRNA
ncbi:metal-dependent hydrolase [Aquabacterium sp.]|uniref:metal-dependent hydrolase n=1 Tax=Aquabacterium sp. TaxID=1872578 RepID=UPI00344B6552